MRILKLLFCAVSALFIMGCTPNAPTVKSDDFMRVQGQDLIASTGANTIRLPFHYKLFTDEDYMGLSVNQDGYIKSLLMK